MEIVCLKIAIACYLLSTVAFLLPLLTSRTIPRALAPALLLTAFVAHAGSIAARSLAAGYIAVIDSYEALSFFACLTAGVYLLAQFRSPVAILGAVVSPLCFVLTLGAFVFYTQARDLPPSLHSVWLPVHVTLAFLGNAVFGVAFSASLV